MGGPPQGSLESFLQSLLPRISFDADVVDTLLDWPRPWDALAFLHQIDDRSEIRKLTKVRGKDGWWEVPDINTGRVGKPRMGRIYYCPVDDDRVFAVLHEKKNDAEGDRFIRMLPDQP